MAAAKGLGKGLSALISENYVQPSAPAKPLEKSEGGVATLAHNKLVAGKYQPRSVFDDKGLEELSASIKKNGIMQPVLVRLSEKQPGKYEIVAGERRWRAAKLANLSEIPVIIRDITDQQALEMALVENIQRQDLSPLEEAKGYQRLIDEFSYTQEKLAGVIGKSRSHIANTIRLMSLPEEVKAMIDRGELTAGHARALLNAPNPLELAKEIVMGGLNVREAEQVGRQAKGKDHKDSRPRARRASDKPKDPDIIALEASLSENLGVNVSINDRGQSGEIILAYDSLAQLDDILRRLSDSI